MINKFHTYELFEKTSINVNAVIPKKKNSTCATVACCLLETHVCPIVLHNVQEDLIVYGIILTATWKTKFKIIIFIHVWDKIGGFDFKKKKCNRQDG